MKNIIIGTAGHIDHGKTTLIKALTGRNTDRFKEEIKRGITIDLGFTYFNLPDGSKAGIIDVPGHEKFIKNMLAGVVGMDMVLLVIAADEGIMPQTEEHINILNLLGLKKGIIVLSKCDLVDEEWLHMIKDHIKESLKDTFLKNAPIVEVSSKTGYGLDILTGVICEVSDKELKERDIDTLSRLPIDRVFSVQGFGTVVTGTLISGKLKKGDEIEVLPIKKICKVRNIQVHGTDAEEAFAGQRTALNITNIDKSELLRGYVIAPVNSMHNTKLIDVKLSLLKGSKRIVENKSRLHLYTGTSEILCRAILLDCNELSPGESCYAQLRLEEETAVRRGDKFIVRFYSPLETIGGGIILEPFSKAKKRFDKTSVEELKLKEDGSIYNVVEKVIKENSKFMISLDELAKIAALTEKELKKYIEMLNEEEIISVFNLKNGIYIWHKDYEINFINNLNNILKQFHKENKYKKGIKKSEIKSRFFLNVKQPVFDVMIQSLTEKGKFKIDGELLSDNQFVVEYDENYKNAKYKILKILNDEQYKFLTASEIQNIPGIEFADDIVNLLIKDDVLIKINDECITSSSIYKKAKEILIDYLKANDSITVAEYRDLLKVNRKNAIFLLESFDLLKVTKRIDNNRLLY